MNAQLDIPLTLEDVMTDLAYGREPVVQPDVQTPTAASLPRPTIAGAAFRRSWLGARALGAIHPRLARRSLLRLWFTPWVHPTALRPVEDMPAELRSWSLTVPTVEGASLLRGFQGGAGPTAVLVHGWSGRAADWRHLAGDLIAAGWRVVAPDLPAHGLTPGEQTDLFQLGRSLAGVLRHERPALVVTHSMGFPTTVLALEGGAPEPERIVALAPGRKMTRAVDGFAARARLPEPLIDELRDGIEQRFGPDIWRILDVDRALTGLQPAGLVVHDTDDDEVPLADAEHIAANWRGAELVTTQGFGHRRILRNETVRRRIVDHLG